MNSVFQENFYKKCTGCGACANACPFQAISVCENKNGFLYPQIDENLCINCKKCEKICPENNNFQRKTNYTSPECLAVWAKEEIRLPSASGGVFGAIAKAFLAEGNYVCGAVYESIYRVKHIVTNKTSDLPQIIGSKYVQSNTENCYREIKQILDKGYKVLFCGCPCQVAGLFSVVGEHNSLFTMDLVCHGVPGYEFYLDYLKKYEEPEKIDFRDKSVFGWSSSINLTLKDGRIVRKSCDEDTFFKGFLPCIVQRESCSQCSYSSLPRIGDLTIGDFWGIRDYKRNLDDGKGTSVVLVNNEKGKFLMENFHNLFQLVEKVPIVEAIRINKNIERPLNAHPSRQRFFRDYDIVQDKDKLIEMCRSAHYDIGIVGLWFGLNFGSVLTYYALYKVINSLGYSALMINKPKFMWIDRYENPNTIAQKFIRKHCNVSSVKDELTLQELSNHCDSFVVGSDVVWNYEICGKTAKQFLFLDFADDSKCKKISYASSLGTGYDAPTEIHALSKYYLQKFDYISVREQEAADICLNKFDVKADIVMDSVFLCEKEHYYNIANDTQKVFPQKYIGAYILGPDILKKEMLLTLQKEYHMPFQIMPNPNEDEQISQLQWENESEILHNGEVEDFLACIKNCEYFFADSFHGLCFAIIFHKKFVVVTGKYQKDNCRFKNLLKTIGLENRLIYIEDFIENKNLITEQIRKEIDFDQVDMVLQKKSEESIEWLKNALSSPKKNHVSIEDFLMKKIQKQDKEIKELSEKTDRLKETLILSFSYNHKYAFAFEKKAFAFLNKLAKGLDNKIIFLAACDTVGLAINFSVQEYFSQLGVTQNLINQHWKGYVAILDSGKIVFEELGKETNDSVEKTLYYDGLHINVKSHPLNSGNFAEISIDDINYSLNKRGINIVVYDNVMRKVICKSVIDTHSPTFEFESYNLIL